MFKKFFLILSLLFAVGVTSQAQWQLASVFPADSSQGFGTHGIAVDPDGKVWIQCYYAYGRDSIQVPGYDAATGALKDVKATVRALYVFNPDGTQASFSPILFNKVGGVVKDTLGGETSYKKILNPVGTDSIMVPAWGANTGRGLTLDENGNVVAGYWDYLFKFDYKTGEGLMDRLVAGIGGVVKPGIDAAGNFYVRSVVGGGPLKMFDKAGVALGNALDVTTGFSRVIDVTKDGLTIYHTAYTNHYVQKLHRADEFSSFLPDTLLRGFDCESVVWDPAKADQIWFSSGSYNDLPNRYPTEVTNYDVAAWYAFDTKTETLTGEKINWDFYVDKNAAERPRAIGFSPDGNTAYVGTFSAGAVRKYTKATGPTTVEFKCDMSVQIKRGTFAVGDSVWVRGNYNDWAGKATQLEDPDGDSVYTGVFDTFTAGQDLVFKYVHSPDVWESTGNRLLTVASGANVTSACWEDVCVYIPSKTIKVAFTVNMELERLSGLFDPATATVSVRGSFNGWGETMMAASGTNADLYEVVADVIAAVDEKVSFKFFYSPGAWEVNNLTDMTQNDRYFIVDQAVFDAGTMSYDAIGFNNGSLETVLNQNANITFTCNTNGASIINAPVGTAFETVHMAGGNSPLQWPGGGWPDADITKVIQLFDDGTHGDVTAGDKIFTTNTIVFPQYATLNVVYKYGANWGLATNGGANDNEGGVGSDKTLKMDKMTASATVVDTFGIVHTTSLTKIEKFGNELPTIYALAQNYPNPFNPETSIRFSIPQESFVTVKVFNTLGEEVATLVNEEKTAGTYNVSFNARSLTSGIYFYTIKANNFSSTKKMILMK